MMKLVIYDRERHTEQTCTREWSNLVQKGYKDRKVKLSRLIAYLTILAYSNDPQDQAAFDMIMFNMSMALQCEGVVTMTTSRPDVLRQANSELASILMSSDEETSLS